MSRHALTNDQEFFFVLFFTVEKTLSSKLDSWWKLKDKRVWGADMPHAVDNKEHFDSLFCKSMFLPQGPLSNTSFCWLGLQGDEDKAGARLPKCLHLSYRCCYIGLLQIKWLSKMLIKTSNNLHFVYSNLHNCAMTQYWVLLPCSDFHQLSSIFDVLTLINTAITVCVV